ncbi:MAG: MBL fold metallo-hydrolase [Bacteroidota bacterium]
MLHIKSFTFSPVQENTYLLYNDAGEACIIDPGCYNTYEEQQLDDFIKQQKLVPGLLLNTHCHLDHVFGLKWAAEKYGLTPHIHTLEKQMLEMAPISGDMWNLPFKGYKGALNFLTEGQTIRLGSDELQVLFAPGHSPGHVCFYNEIGNNNIPYLIGGDVLFRESIGRTDLPFGDHQTLIQNIKTKLFTLPDQTVVYPGHGDSTTIGFEKKYNPFLQ